MSTCNIDHSKADVQNKLESQKDFLPNDLYINASHFLDNELTQLVLNELFHLLKKYDLVEKEEQEKRNQLIKELVNK